MVAESNHFMFEVRYLVLALILQLTKQRSAVVKWLMKVIPLPSTENAGFSVGLHTIRQLRKTPGDKMEGCVER